MEFLKITCNQKRICEIKCNTIICTLLFNWVPSDYFMLLYILNSLWILTGNIY